MTDTSITGNQIRDAMLFQAIGSARADDGTVALPAVQALLPGDFDLSEPELADVLAAIAEPETAAASATVESEPAADQEPAAKAPTMTREEAQEAVRLAHESLAHWRAQLISTGNAQRKARAALATAVSAFVQGQQPTREQLIRSEIAAGQQQKQDLKDGKIAMRRQPRLRSVIDQTAFYGRGGSPAGGGNSFRQGAMTTSHAARYGFRKAVTP